MNNRARSEAADKRRPLLLYSARDGVRDLRTERIGVTELAVVLSLVYRYGPDAKQRFRSVGLGAALAVIMWTIASVGFSFYLANFADYGLTYGSLGAAVGLLFYLYLCASVVLLGTEVNSAIYQAAPDRAAQAGKLASEDETMETHRAGMSVQGDEDDS